MADFEAAARLKYGETPKVQKELEARNGELVALQKEHRLLKEEVDDEDIAKIVSRWTGIPVQKMLEGEVQKLIKMEERLHARVVGQDEAVTAVANAVRRGRAGLSDPNRPIGSFIFLGPTGVGKTELARALAEFVFDDKQKAVLEAVRHNFRPEFLNRIDEIIIFSPLSREQIKEIVNIQLERLRKRLGERRIALQLTPAALELIAEEGYDPTYGARPLKRVIQRRIQDPLAMAVLDGQFKEGDTVLVDAEKGELVLRKAGAKEHVGVAAS